MKSELTAIMNRLDERGQHMPLMPTSIWDAKLEKDIAALDWRGVEEDVAIIALMAGLHLRNDSLDTSHSYAQQIEHDATGAYWHGVMHRMEGDFPNAKYWYARAGRHPAMEEAARQIALVLRDSLDLEAIQAEEVKRALRDFRDGAGWHPAAFTDLVQWQRGRSIEPALKQLLERMQAIEMRALFDYTLEACAPKLERI